MLRIHNTPCFFIQSKYAAIYLELPDTCRFQLGQLGFQSLTPLILCAGTLKVRRSLLQQGEFCLNDCNNPVFLWGERVVLRLQAAALPNFARRFWCNSRFASIFTLALRT